MKIGRIRLQNGETHYASPIGELGNIMEILEGDPFQGIYPTGRKESHFKLLAPIVPKAILCVGLNYRKHANEMGTEFPNYPILFFKNPSALLNPREDIVIPRNLVSTKVDYEGELAVIIGRTCLNANRENALDYVMGYTIANDVSARDWQSKERGGTQWCRAKSFDSFAPMGPWIVTSDEIGDPNNLQIYTLINGERLQNSTTADMIFNIPSLIEFLSGDTTLEAGTVILTGTPEGVGAGQVPERWLQTGDQCCVEIEKIGVLENGVA